VPETIDYEEENHWTWNSKVKARTQETCLHVQIVRVA
jgi:hypothetical protein